MLEKGSSYQLSEHWHWLVFPTREQADHARARGVHSIAVHIQNSANTQAIINYWTREFDLDITLLPSLSCFIVVEMTYCYAKIIGAQVGWIVLVDHTSVPLDKSFLELTAE